MQSPGREPSMEDILASIKKVIAEEKELRTAAPPIDAVEDEPLPEETSGGRRRARARRAARAADRPRPAADRRGCRRRRAARRSSSCRPSPRPSRRRRTVNPLEEMVREMLRPMLKQWLDEHLPQMVDEHVKREISRITGRPL